LQNLNIAYDEEDNILSPTCSQDIQKDVEYMFFNTVRVFETQQIGLGIRNEEVTEPFIIQQSIETGQVICQCHSRLVFRLKPEKGVNIGLHEGLLIDVGPFKATWPGPHTKTRFYVAVERNCAQDYCKVGEEDRKHNIMNISSPSSEARATAIQNREIVHLTT
jgi:hypothetical protein